MKTTEQKLSNSITPGQRHEARLAARKFIEDGNLTSSRFFVVLPDNEPPAPRNPQMPPEMEDLRCRQIDLRIARATCPVHPDMLTILHLDEQIDGNPCPLCWAAAALVRPSKPAPTPPSGPGRKLP